jgi:hypothetical protein
MNTVIVLKCFQLLICADDVNFLGGIVTTLKKYTEALLGASLEVGMNVSAERTNVFSCPIAKVQ